MRRICRGFTLVELIFVMAIISLLITMLIPAIGLVKEAGRGIKCKANLRVLATAIGTYAANNGDHVPMASGGTMDSNSDPSNDVPRWGNHFTEDMGMPTEALNCPSISSTNLAWAGGTDWVIVGGETGGYGINGLYANLNDKDKPQGPDPQWGSILTMRRPAEIIAFTATKLSYFGHENTPGTELRFRHVGDNAINVVMFDAHAETWERDDVGKIKGPARHSRQLIEITDYNYLPWMDPP